MKRRSHSAEIREGESIQVDVVEQGPQIQIAAASSRFDENGLVAVAEKPAPFMVPGVKASCVGKPSRDSGMETAFGGGAEWNPLGRSGAESILEPRHALDQVGCRGLNQKVVMISHEHPGGATMAQIRNSVRSQHSPTVFKKRDSSAPSGEAKIRLRQRLAAISGSDQAKRHRAGCPAANSLGP